MSCPWAGQNLQMPHPRDWQGGKMPHSSPWGGGGAEPSRNWLMHNTVLKMGQCSVRWLTAWERGLRNGTVLRGCHARGLKKRLCPPAGVDQIKPDQEPKGLILQSLVPGYGFLAWSERHVEGSAQKVEYKAEGSGMWLCKMEGVLFHSVRHWSMIQLGVGGALISGFALNNVKTLSSFGRTLLPHGYFFWS